MKCKYCKAELRKGDKFCYSCGSPVSEEKSVGDELREAAEEVKEEVTEATREFREETQACFGPRGRKAGLWGAISGGVFIVGLGLLWLFDWWWPGILFLIGAMIVIGGLVSYGVNR